MTREAFPSNSKHRCHAAYFVDKNFEGTEPGDIPIEQSTKFGSVVNLKTAEALGID
jgi:putative tryptophan/tyrosine transport system substrate-binding protein